MTHRLLDPPEPGKRCAKQVLNLGNTGKGFFGQRLF
jgi:hypothetical protein